MTRIADFAQVQFLAAQLQQTQKKVNDDGIQLSSGQKSPTYAGIASDAQTVLNMQTTSAKIDRYVANANTADTRAQLTSNALQTMQDSLKNLLNQLDIVPANISTLAYQAQSYLKTVADALNVQDGTRTIFGGSNTAGPVVVVADPNSAVLGATDPAAANQSIFGSPAANLAASSAGYRYQITAGGTTAANAVKISDTVSVTPQLNVNPNATVPPAGPLGTNAFTQMLDAFAAVADFGNATLNPNPTPTDIANARQQIFNALNGVAGTYSGLEAMQTQVETVRSTIKVVQDSQTNLQTYATNTIANIQNVDTNETSVKLLQDQNQLQMSMSVLAKITSISLLDYLK